MIGLFTTILCKSISILAAISHNGDAFLTISDGIGIATDTLSSSRNLDPDMYILSSRDLDALILVYQETFATVASNFNDFRDIHGSPMYDVEEER